jgi:phospholipid transport system substrate-binding protein
MHARLGCRAGAARGIALLLLTAAATALYAGAPTDQVRATTDRIIAIVADPALKGSAQADTRRQRIRAEIDSRFDWEAMGALAIGSHWDGRTPEEKREFLQLFASLLERSYLGRIEGYAGERVSYVGEDGAADGTAGVRVAITTTQQTEIPVEYRLRASPEGEWRVVDIRIEGVSLVQNYQAQFAAILKKDSFPGLLKQLRKKVGAK